MEGLALRSRRRIIERPRLLRALDRSSSNLRTIVASAGYGKTTLAEQWAAVDGRRVGWYRARTSASDVSVVARGFVEAAAAIVPDAGRRLLERLAVTSDPDRDAAVLAEMLATDLAEWPTDGWIVVDDYQFVQAAPDPETFVETLVANAPVQLVLVGRNRPRWVTGRDVLYGDVLEIGRAALAMTADEIDEMLGARAGDLSAGLLALADGWPAVVALSTATSHAELPPGTDVPEELFDFFAEEVFRGLDERLRRSLSLLAHVPLITRDLAATVLGDEEAVAAISGAADVGLLDARDGFIVLHPLAVSFLERRAPHSHLSPAVSGELIRAYVGWREWDAAFQVASAGGAPAQLTAIVEAGAEDMLRSGRLGTLENWLAAAAEAGVMSPVSRIVEAELALRHGRSVTALTLLEREISKDDPTLTDFRVLALAARAAHIVAREEDALAYFDVALARASSRSERRIALEGKLMCASTLELESASDLLATLEALVDRSDPEEVVRLADRSLSFSYRFGTNTVKDALPFLELVDRIQDPVTAVSFLNLVGWGLVLSSDYRRALDIADRAVGLCMEYRVDLALPWVKGTRAMALGGLRDYEAAFAEVREGRCLAETFSDLNGIQNAHALEVRLLIQQGRSLEASALEMPSLKLALPFMEGELFASRALALAACGRLEESRKAQERALTASRGVETKVFVAAADATCASRSRDGTQLGKCEFLLGLAFETDTTDPVVTALRGCPDILETMISRADMRERVIHALYRSGDTDLLAEGAGDGSILKLLDPAASLSTRELEVLALVRQGLSNGQIAKQLFIEASTVKSHLHRIYDKTGVRSRAALVASASGPR